MDKVDPRRREYILEVFADQTFVKDIVKGRRLLLGWLSLRPTLLSLCSDH